MRKTTTFLPLRKAAAVTAASGSPTDLIVDDEWYLLAHGNFNKAK